jgi:hypothetical protein
MRPLPYQRGQFWIRRFHAHAESLCAALAALTKPTPAPGFVHRALTMLESVGWIGAHRFLFAGVRCHLLGWPGPRAKHGRRKPKAEPERPGRKADEALLRSGKRQGIQRRVESGPPKSKCR